MHPVVFLSQLFQRAQAGIEEKTRQVFPDTGLYDTSDTCCSFVLRHFYSFEKVPFLLFMRDINQRVPNKQNRFRPHLIVPWGLQRVRERKSLWRL